ncbi:MAG: peroxidase family protein [Planctomycetota bacterium]
MDRAWVIAALVASASSVAAQEATEGSRESKGRVSETVELDRRGTGNSLVQRGPVPSRALSFVNDSHGRSLLAVAAEYPLEFRTIDGLGNNPISPDWGAVGIPLLRLVPDAYHDGLSQLARDPSVTGGPSAREVSNAVHAQSSPIPSPLNASDYLWQWGQFLDHDIDETPIASPAIEAPIAVPAGDPFFLAPIGLDRSAALAGAAPDGPDVREQLNNITSYIDASNVYGSDDGRAAALRELDGTGRLKMSDGRLLMYNTGGLHNAPTDDDPSFFLAGDIRANEQAGLAAMHTLWVREHNYWADRLGEENPGLMGDEVYERARAIVAAEMQAITYNEFLPLLLGDGAIPAYGGYDDVVDASISNVFATAAYRVGHTMLSSHILRLDYLGAEVPAEHLALRDAFFDPSILEDEGIDSILRGLAAQTSQAIDRHLVDDVRNFLFGPPGAGGFDLASLNIQRGREHGLGSYNDVRVAFGLGAVASFEAINPDPAVHGALSGVYASVDDIDPWTGMLCEPRVSGALVGETLIAVLADQFVRLRDGDRFWYEAYLPEDLRQMVDGTRLSDVIRRNTEIGREIQDEVFVQADPCFVDLTGDGLVSQADIDAFVDAYFAKDELADFNRNGVRSYTDVVLFVQLYLAGCGG